MTDFYVTSNGKGKSSSQDLFLIKSSSQDLFLIKSSSRDLFLIKVAAKRPVPDHSR
jgi:hypothetical protein